MNTVIKEGDRVKLLSFGGEGVVVKIYDYIWGYKYLVEIKPSFGNILLKVFIFTPQISIPFGLPNCSLLDIFKNGTLFGFEPTIFEATQSVENGSILAIIRSSLTGNRPNPTIPSTTFR